MSTATVENNLMNYEFMTKDGKKVTVEIEDSEENPQFKIQGPKELMQKVIGGLGGENETDAWVTEKELNTEAKRTTILLEVMQLIK